MPVKKGKGASDYMPVRKPPAGVKMPASKNIAPKPKTPVKTTTKAPAKAKMTPQDAAMKKILEKKHGKIYG